MNEIYVVMSKITSLILLVENFSRKFSILKRKFRQGTFAAGESSVHLISSKDKLFGKNRVVLRV
jgi:hypothetical protein